MTYVLALGNQKGGCSKTSTCLNLGYALSKLGKKVLLVDMDSQQSLALNVGVDFQKSKEFPYTVDEILDEVIINPNKKLQWEEVKKCIYTPTFVNSIRDPENKMKWKEVNEPFGFDVMPGALNLSVIDLKISMAVGVRRFFQTDYLDRILTVLKQNSDYDYILIDTPPSLGGLSLTAYTAAKDGIIVVSSLDVMSVRGINTFITTTETVKKNVPGHRGILGIVLALYSERRVVDRDINEWVKDFLPIPTFNTRIPESGFFKRANSNTLVASQLDKKVYKSFISLANEVVHACENPDDLIGSALEEQKESEGTK